MAKVAKKIPLTIRGAKRQLVSDSLRDMLGEEIPEKLLKKIAPEFHKALPANSRMPTVAFMLARKLVAMALDPAKGNFNAVNAVLERSEGKASPGSPIKQSEAVIEDKLDDISTQHLNTLAAAFFKRALGGEHPNASPQDAPGRDAVGMDVPDHRASRTQGAGREPPVADGAAPPSGGRPQPSHDADVGVEAEPPILD